MSSPQMMTMFGLLLLLRGCWHAHRHDGSEQCEQTEPDIPDPTHALFPCWLPKMGRQPAPK